MPIQRVSKLWSVLFSMAIGGAAYAADAPAKGNTAKPTAGQAGEKGGNCGSCPMKHEHGQGHGDGHGHMHGHGHGEGCCRGMGEGKGCPMKVLNSDKVDLKVEDTPTGALIRVNAKSTVPADLQQVREAARALSTCCPGGKQAGAPAGSTPAAPAAKPSR